MKCYFPPDTFLDLSKDGGAQELNVNETSRISSDGGANSSDGNSTTLVLKRDVEVENEKDAFDNDLKEDDENLALVPAGEKKKTKGPHLKWLLKKIPGYTDHPKYSIRYVIQY